MRSFVSRASSISSPIPELNHEGDDEHEDRKSDAGAAFRRPDGFVIVVTFVVNDS
jgi:hypothetical protein